MNYPEYTDPSEWVGTEEYEELRSEREAKRQQLLDLMAEQEDEEFIQYPQKFSH
tara:strand:+ start:963 stop:1124 length:162 start_codon:yes stop_codon:yes gene_type:complete